MAKARPVLQQLAHGGERRFANLTAVCRETSIAPIVMCKLADTGEPDEHGNTYSFVLPAPDGTHTVSCVIPLAAYDRLRERARTAGQNMKAMAARLLIEALGAQPEDAAS